jgi:chromosome segregation protein
MLKQLELQGFKSFAQKTTLEFPKGITAIVGPNGSGKSNIVDAVRWVLGEQSLKNLRSEKSEDVIFAGNPQKPATSLATVLLLFDNSNNIFPLPNLEITVGRKIYRGGESEYLLNRQPARLKDITQLLAGARLGIRGLAVINQGAGDVFLTASGKERREMLEEALGLKEYRLKKEEAGRKLEETKINLGEVSRLLEELEPHLRSLKRQASRWEKRQEKETLLKTLEEEFFFRKIQELRPSGIDFSKEKEALLEELSELQKEIADLQAEFSALEQSFPKTTQESEGLRSSLQELERKRSSLAREIGKIEGQIETLRDVSNERDFSQKILLDSIVHTKEQISQTLLLTDIVEIKESLKKVLDSLEEFLKKPDDKKDFAKPLLEAKEKLMLEFEEVGKAIEVSSRNLANKVKIQDTSSAKVREVLENLERKKDEIREKEKLLREYQFEEEKKRLKEEDIRIRMREAGWDYDEFLKAQHEPSLELEEIPLEELETRILRLRRDLADIGLVDTELIKEYNETSLRVEFIKNQKEDLEKALKDLTDLSEKLEEKIKHDFDKGLEDISGAFDHYFKLIFDGGSARIYQRKIKAETSENELILESNLKENSLPEIEISVSLPRKKIKGIEMLSGGERALTSIAVLFAIVGSSTPPFLVLDEVDAPLDETNSQRFARLLKDLSEKTQFIVITHNRATMEVAEVLYGIAMEDGISKVFSLKFEEAQEIAAQDVHELVT